MKTLKIFTVVLGIHLLATPLVILQISREPKVTDAIVTADEIADLDSMKRVENAAVLPLEDNHTHTVSQGENPSTIAASYGMTTATLMEINGITDARGLRVGQKLKVHKKPG